MAGKVSITSLACLNGVGVTRTGQYFASFEMMHRVGASMGEANLNTIEVTKVQAEALMAHVQAGKNPHFNVTLESV